MNALFSDAVATLLTLDTARSADGGALTVAITLSVLLARLESKACELTVTVLVNWMACRAGVWAVTQILTVPLCPLVNTGISTVTRLPEFVMVPSVVLFDKTLPPMAGTASCR